MMNLPTTTTGIVVLLLVSCPSAILRGVGPVVVDSVQRVERPAVAFAFGAPSHVSEEVLKGIPAFTYCDPTPTVMLEGRRIGIATPRAHVAPSLILDALTPVASFAVSEVDPRAMFAPPVNTVTPTGFRLPLSKDHTGDFMFVSARASDQPTCSVFTPFKNGPSSKCLPFQINGTRMSLFKSETSARRGHTVSQRGASNSFLSPAVASACPTVRTVRACNHNPSSKTFTIQIQLGRHPRFIACVRKVSKG